MEHNIPQVKTYSGCLEIIQKALKGMNKPHGTLKTWCEKHSLNYQKVIKIKNGSEKSYRPLFIQKILVALGYRVSFVREFGNGHDGEDIFTLVKVVSSENPNGEKAPQE